MSGDAAGSPASFADTLNARIAERQADGGQLAVLLIECEVIGRIDAVWGYRVGDAVRERIKGSLRSEVLRADDLIGEMSRDEFACVLSTVDGPAVAQLAAQKSLRTLNQPFWVGEEEISASPAIGIALYPQNGEDAEGLLQRAKSASMTARGASGRIHEYEEQGEDTAEVQLLHENRLRAAIADEALELVFQPQYDLRLGQVMGAASLLCWRDPTLGLIAADDAFVAAEAEGRVADLVSAILNRALRSVSELRYSAGLDLRIGVKLPARALLQTELPEVIERALGTWNRRSGSLILEIRDTALLGSEAVARETLVRLKELGVKLSIDDPAITLPSLFWLGDLPFVELKLDVSPVVDLTGNAKAQRILQSIIELAHFLRFAVVAVGVPDDAAAAKLKELRCDYMQADYKGPALDFQGFVERYGFSED